MRKCGAKLLWLIIMLSLAAVMGELLIGGGILLYLAPRIVPMVWLGLIVITGLSVYQGFQVIQCLRGRQTAEKGRLGMLLFFVPVLLILTAAPNTDTPGSLPNRNVKRIPMAGKNAADTARTADSQAEETAAAQADAAAGFVPCVLESERAYFNPSADAFSDYLHETAEDLAGKTITVYGFVYSNDSFPDNTVLVSRLMLICCAADASVVGFYVQVEADSNLEQNEWIRVTGTIRSMKLFYCDGYYDFPVLTEGIILRCDAPDAENAYIYP
jgi:putative membrane protein